MSKRKQTFQRPIRMGSTVLAGSSGDGINLMVDKSGMMNITLVDNDSTLRGSPSPTFQANGDGGVTKLGEKGGVNLSSAPDDIYLTLNENYSATKKGNQNLSYFGELKRNSGSEGDGTDTKVADATILASNQDDNQSHNYSYGTTPDEDSFTQRPGQQNGLGPVYALAENFLGPSDDSTESNEATRSIAPSDSRTDSGDHSRVRCDGGEGEHQDNRGKPGSYDGGQTVLEKLAKQLSPTPFGPDVVENAEPRDLENGPARSLGRPVEEQPSVVPATMGTDGPKLKVLLDEAKGERQSTESYVQNTSYANENGSTSPTNPYHNSTDHVLPPQALRPFTCKECGFAFTNKSNCERHMRKKHGKKTRRELLKSAAFLQAGDEAPSNKEPVGKNVTTSCSSSSLTDSPSSSNSEEGFVPDPPNQPCDSKEGHAMESLRHQLNDTYDTGKPNTTKEESHYACGICGDEFGGQDFAIRHIVLKHPQEKILENIRQATPVTITYHRNIPSEGESRFLERKEHLGGSKEREPEPALKTVLDIIDIGYDQPLDFSLAGRSPKIGANSSNKSDCQAQPPPLSQTKPKQPQQMVPRYGINSHPFFPGNANYSSFNQRSFPLFPNYGSVAGTNFPNPMPGPFYGIGEGERGQLFRSATAPKLAPSYTGHGHKGDGGDRSDDDDNNNNHGGDEFNDGEMCDGYDNNSTPSTPHSPPPDSQVFHGDTSSSTNHQSFLARKRAYSEIGDGSVDEGDGASTEHMLQEEPTGPEKSKVGFFDPRAVPYRTPGPRKFICVYCHNTYSSRGNVNRHIRNTHFKMKRANKRVTNGASLYNPYPFPGDKISPPSCPVPIDGGTVGLSKEFGLHDNNGGRAHQQISPTDNFMNGRSIAINHNNLGGEINVGGEKLFGSGLNGTVDNFKSMEDMYRKWYSQFYYPPSTSFDTSLEHHRRNLEAVDNGFYKCSSPPVPCKKDGTASHKVNMVPADLKSMNGADGSPYLVQTCPVIFGSDETKRRDTTDVKPVAVQGKQANGGSGSHSGMRPSPCPLCGLNFSTKSNRNRHIFRKHRQTYATIRSSPFSHNDGMETGSLANGNAGVQSPDADDPTNEYNVRDEECERMSSYYSSDDNEHESFNDGVGGGLTIQELKATCYRDKGNAKLTGTMAITKGIALPPPSPPPLPSTPNLGARKISDDEGAVVLPFPCTVCRTLASNGDEQAVVSFRDEASLIAHLFTSHREALANNRSLVNPYFRSLTAQRTTHRPATNSGNIHVTHNGGEVGGNDSSESTLGRPDSCPSPPSSSSALCGSRVLQNLLGIHDAKELEHLVSQTNVGGGVPSNA